MNGDGLRILVAGVFGLLVLARLLPSPPRVERDEKLIGIRL
jgi:hypothetical protein